MSFVTFFASFLKGVKCLSRIHVLCWPTHSSRFPSVFFFNVLSSFRVFMFIVPSLSLPPSFNFFKALSRFRIYIYYMSMFSVPLPSAVFFCKALRWGFRGLMFSAPPPSPPPALPPPPSPPPPPPPRSRPYPFLFPSLPVSSSEFLPAIFVFLFCFLSVVVQVAYWPTLLLLLFCFAWHCILFAIT